MLEFAGYQNEALAAPLREIYAAYVEVSMVFEDDKIHPSREKYRKTKYRTTRSTLMFILTSQSLSLTSLHQKTSLVFPSV